MLSPGAGEGMANFAMPLPGLGEGMATCCHALSGPWREHGNMLPCPRRALARAWQHVAMPLPGLGESMGGRHPLGTRQGGCGDEGRGGAGGAPIGPTMLLAYLPGVLELEHAGQRSFPSPHGPCSDAGRGACTVQLAAMERATRPQESRPQEFTRCKARCLECDDGVCKHTSGHWAQQGLGHCCEQCGYGEDGYLEADREGDRPWLRRRDVIESSAVEPQDPVDSEDIGSAAEVRAALRGLGGAVARAWGIAAGQS